jgi:hypothetical protein
MREEDTRPLGSADMQRREKPSLGFVILAVAAIGAMVVSSFALAHVLAGKIFHLF